jgi:hypothetical protein
MRINRDSIASRRRDPRVAIAAIAVAIGAAVGTVLASGFTLPASNVSVGTQSFAYCARGTEVQYQMRIASDNSTVIDSVSITGIPASCAGKTISLQLLNASGTLIDEVVWTLQLNAGDTEITARADESTVSSANSSSNGTTINYPNSQTDPEGLVTALAASSVSKVKLLHLPASRAALD